MRSVELGTTVDYTHKSTVARDGVLLPTVLGSGFSTPKNAPDWAKDRESYWRAVEEKENRKDAQFYRECVVSLPSELPREEMVRIAQGWISENFVSQGMVADWALHAPDAGNSNFHFHVMLSMRDFDEHGRLGNKNRSWNKKTNLDIWRPSLAEHINAGLARSGLDIRVTHRGMKDLDLALEPTPYSPPGDTLPALIAAKDAAQTRQRNRDVLEKNPEEFLKVLTRVEGRSTWTTRDMIRVADRYCDTPEQFDRLMTAVQRSPHLSRIEGFSDRFTSAEVIAVEQLLFERSSELASIAVGDRALSLDRRLSDAQRAAAQRIVCGPALVCIEGHPGSGKSFAAAAAVQQLKREGKRVITVGYSAKQSREFAAEAGIDNVITVDGLLTAWQHGAKKWELGPNDVLVVDEAGMVGTRDMLSIISATERAKARVVLVGDSAQLPAIRHGAPFRALSERHGAVALSENRRQREAWQRDALARIRAGDERAGLQKFVEHGAVSVSDDKPAQLKEMAAAWARAEAEGKEALMLAYRRADVQALNEAARKTPEVARRLTGPEYVWDTIDGDAALRKGDRIMFRHNCRDLKVFNGDLGTIERIDAESATVRLSDGSLRRVDREKYVRPDEPGSAMTPAYAITGHKAQGVTKDSIFVYADARTSKQWLYVAMSRNRHQVKVFAPSLNHLKRGLGRSAQKHMAHDAPDAKRVRPVVRKESRAEVQIGDREYAKATLAAGRPELTFADLEQLGLQRDKINKVLDAYDEARDSARAVVARAVNRRISAPGDEVAALKRISEFGRDVQALRDGSDGTPRARGRRTAIRKTIDEQRVAQLRADLITVDEARRGKKESVEIKPEEAIARRAEMELLFGGKDERQRVEHFLKRCDARSERSTLEREAIDREKGKLREMEKYKKWRGPGFDGPGGGFEL
jgi:Ti-type conjugative transfer relaxase TraA